MPFYFDNCTEETHYLPAIEEIDPRPRGGGDRCLERSSTLMSCTLEEGHLGYHCAHGIGRVIHEIWGSPTWLERTYGDPPDHTPLTLQGLYSGCSGIDGVCSEQSPRDISGDRDYICTRAPGHFGVCVAAYSETAVCLTSDGTPVVWMREAATLNTVREAETSETQDMEVAKQMVEQTKKVVYAGSPLLQISVSRAAGTRDLKVKFKSEILAQFVDELHVEKGWLINKLNPRDTFSTAIARLRRGSGVFDIPEPRVLFEDEPVHPWWIFLPELRTGQTITTNTFTTRKVVRTWLSAARELTARFYVEHMLPMEYDLKITAEAVERVPRADVTIPEAVAVER